MLVHEFQADRDTAGHFNRRAYSQLILKLAMRRRQHQLGSGFSGMDNRRRLRMIAQARSPRALAWAYAFVGALMLLALWPLTQANAALLPSLRSESGIERLLEGKNAWLVMGYFEHRPMEGPDGVRHASHRKLAFATRDSLALLCPVPAAVESLARMESLEANDLRLVLTDAEGLRWTWEGLSASAARPGDRFETGDTLGWVLPAGAPSGFSLSLWQDGKPIDPTEKLNAFRP